MCHNYEIELHNEQLLTFYFIAKCLLSEIPRSCNNHTLKDWSKAKSIMICLCASNQNIMQTIHIYNKKTKKRLRKCRIKSIDDSKNLIHNPNLID